MNGRGGGTRTPDPRIRNPMLYPAELHPRKLLAYFNRRVFIKPLSCKMGMGKRPYLNPMLLLLLSALEIVEEKIVDVLFPWRQRALDLHILSSLDQRHEWSELRIDDQAFQ